MANKTATQTQQQPKAATTPHKPVHELRLGRLKAAIWENPTDSRLELMICSASPSWQIRLTLGWSRSSRGQNNRPLPRS
jgi:hypothetical protein